MSASGPSGPLVFEKCHHHLKIKLLIFDRHTASFEIEFLSSGF